MINRLGPPLKPKKTIKWTLLKPYKGWRLVKIKGEDGTQILFVATVWLDHKNDVVSWIVRWISLKPGETCKMSDEEILKAAGTNWNSLDEETARDFFPEFSARARYRK